MDERCFCGGGGKYWDYNCGEGFYVTCPHCHGTGAKKCQCGKPSTSCDGRRGQEVLDDETIAHKLLSEMSWDEYWEVD